MCECVCPALLDELEIVLVSNIAFVGIFLLILNNIVFILDKLLGDLGLEPIYGLVNRHAQDRTAMARATRSIEGVGDVDVWFWGGRGFDDLLGRGRVGAVKVRVKAGWGARVAACPSAVALVGFASTINRVRSTFM